ncbi:hypothetical protein GGP41_007844 [Bipolaris sorokiniana]|uniref:Xylanolytic transcriptional activator regulatory domain-containing protein n=1 Tax=Cochliobolus sativus TaxID=45130 RepID=A0A8H5ZKS8_COCSA|nr:hypothetical protein GGP41_007844 [Bipolaris sorokiniana]
MAVGSLGKRSREEALSDGGATDISGSVNSDDGSQLLDEDLLRNSDSRATGFVGQNSEIQWLRDLKTQIGSRASEEWERPYGSLYKLQGSNKEAVVQREDALHTQQQSPKVGNISRVSDSTFYLDSDDLDVDIMVDPYELPSPETAEKLFDCYMRTIHDSFPIVSDYAHLIQAEWRADERDHLIYMTRAIWILRLDKVATSLRAPSLPIIQATGLLSLYYLTAGHVSRAWMMIGKSLRFALAVGLHLRNDDPSASPKHKESLVRTWWSLHSIESQLCALIGRPCIIPNNECTVPLPQVLPVEQSINNVLPRIRDPTGIRRENITLSELSRLDISTRRVLETDMHVSFLQARVKLAVIMQKALSKLYLPRASMVPWQQTQKEITSLTREIDEWVAEALPEGLGPVDFIQEHRAQCEPLLLRFHYHSARLVISRPSLCRLERRIKAQSDASATFDKNTAKTCIHAAQEITRLFPDQPDLMFIYQRSPWWCTVHYIMQAIAAFLLEMSSETGTTQEGEELSKSIDKLVRWLWSMGPGNPVAKRAYEVVMDIIRTRVPRVRTEKSDIFAEEQARPSYSYVAATFNVDTQSTTTLEKKQPVQASGESQPGQDFMLDPALQTLPTFSTPFITDFDQSNLLYTEFFLSRHPMEDYTWMGYPNLLENNQ